MLKQNQDDLSKLYNALKNKGYRDDELAGGEAGFRSFMSDSDNRKNMYDWISQQSDRPFKLGGYDDYESRLSSVYAAATNTTASSPAYSPSLQQPASQQPQRIDPRTPKMLRADAGKTPSFDQSIAMANEFAQRPTQFAHNGWETRDGRTVPRLKKYPNPDAKGSKVVASSLLDVTTGKLYDPSNPDDARGIVEGVSKMSENKELEKVRDKNRAITSLSEGVEQGAKQMYHGGKYLVGEGINLVTGSSIPYAKALEDLYQMQEEGLDIAASVSPSGVMDRETQIAQNGSMEFSWSKLGFDFDNETRSKINRMTESSKIIRDALDQFGGDLSKAKEFIKSKAKEKSYGDEVMEHASSKLDEARPTKGWGWVGELLPQMGGTALAIGASALSRNSKPLQVLSSVVGRAGIAAQTASAMGSGMKEARDYGASTSDAWGAGLLSAAIEYGTEKIPYDRYMGRIGSKLTSSISKGISKSASKVGSEASEELTRLVQKAHNKLGAKFFKGKTAAEIIGDMTTEGLSEFSAEFLQTFAPMIYQNREDYPTLYEAVRNGVEGFKAGVFMGGMLGSASKFAEYKTNKIRRKQQGYVDVVEVSDGSGNSGVFELLGTKEDKAIILKDGAAEEIDRSNVSGSPIRFSYSEFEKGAIEFDQDASHQFGRSLATPEEMQEARVRMQIAREQAVEMFGEDGLSAFDNPEQVDAALDSLDDAQREVVHEYLRNKATYDGMIERVQDDIDDKISQAEAQIEHNTHESGRMIKVTLNGAEPRQVYVKAGNIVMTEDGSMVNASESDSDLFVVDAETGEVFMTSPQDILSIDEDVDAGEYRMQISNEIAQAHAEEVGSSIEGIVTPEVGETYALIDAEGNPSNEVVQQVFPDGSMVMQLEDGSQVARTQEELQQMYDNAVRARVLGNIEAERNGQARQIQETSDGAQLHEANGTTTAPQYNIGDTMELRLDSGEVVQAEVTQEQDADGNIVVLVTDGDGNQHSVGLTADEIAQMSGRSMPSHNTESYPQVQNSGFLGRSMSEEEANSFVDSITRQAEEAKELELTPENWLLEFGEDGRIATPMGEVKMGENQYFKLAQMGRDGKLGMIKPTLANPDIVLEDGRASDGITDRGSSYLFIKAFTKNDGERVYYFTSVTVQKDGQEVVISNQEKRVNRISKLLQNGAVAWINESLHPSSQVKGSVPINEWNRSTSSDNQPASHGINSSLSHKDTKFLEEAAWDSLVEQTEGDIELAQFTADSMVQQSMDAVKKAEKELKAKAKSKTPAEIIQEMKARKAKLATIQKELAHWQAVAGVQAKREAELNRKRQEAQQQADREAQAKAEALRAEAEARQTEADRQARETAERLNGVPEWHNDTAERARERGFRNVHGTELAYRQDELGQRAVLGNTLEIAFSNQDVVPARLALVEAVDVQPSHMQGQRNPHFFIDEAQPKDRREEDSVQAAQQMARNLRPAEITGGVTAYGGSPVINNRGEVVQGNGRSDALLYMYDNLPEQAKVYKQYLMAHAEQFGFTAEAVEAMERPILTKMLEVDDAEAIRLGNMTASDTESGGERRIDSVQTLTKMGKDTENFMRMLFNSANEEASYSQLIEENGINVLQWMHRKGYISDTQYKSAINSRGSLSSDAKTDLSKMVLNSIFQGTDATLKDSFAHLPAKAQNAILATAYRDYSSPIGERVIGELQDSIRAFETLMQNDKFAEAKDIEQALMAIDGWLVQQEFDLNTGELYIPNERLKFSNFALHLAAKYKGNTQKALQADFNELYNLVQGIAEDTLFEQGDDSPRTLKEAIRKVFNVDYNGNEHNGSDALGERLEKSESRGQRSNSRATDSQQVESREGTTQRGGRTTSDGEQVENQTTSTYSLSTISAERGGNFMQDSEGNIDLVRVADEVFEAMEIAPVPLRMTEAMAQHILDRHGKELGITSLEDATAFVVDVMTHFDHVRQGNEPNAYIFSIEDGRDKVGKRAVTLVLPSDNGDYLGVKSSGNESIRKLKTRALIWGKGVKKTSSTDVATANVPTTQSQQGNEKGGNASNQINALESKGSENPTIVEHTTVEPLLDTFVKDTDSSGRASIDSSRYDAEELYAPLLLDNQASNIAVMLGLSDDITDLGRPMAVYDYSSGINEATNEGWQRLDELIGKYNQAVSENDKAGELRDVPLVMFKSVDAAIKFSEWIERQGSNTTQVNIESKAHPLVGKVFASNANGNNIQYEVVGVTDKGSVRVEQKHYDKEGRLVAEYNKTYLRSVWDKMNSSSSMTEVQRGESSVDDGGIRFRDGDNANYEAELAEIKSKAESNGTFMLAPNGEPTKLTERQWLQVRTDAFKRWFGDWEKSARIEKLRNSQPVVISGTEIEPSEDLKQYKKNALEYGKRLQDSYVNQDTGKTISLQRGRKRGGINEVLQHDYKDAEHLQSVAAIPSIIEQAIYIDSATNEDSKVEADSFDYYVAGVQIAGVDYIVRAVVVNTKNGETYYDHKLSSIEKGKLLDLIESQGAYKSDFGTTPDTKSTITDISDVKDTKLVSILRNDASKVVDENGEPLVVYHGTGAKFNAFSTKKTATPMFYFTSERHKIEEGGVGARSAGRIMEVYLNMRNPASWREEDRLTTDQIKHKGYDGKALLDDGYNVYVAFSPTQIKSATDNVGTFNEGDADIRYRAGVDAVLDEAYLSAVERGDMETAQRMVDERAEALGYHLRSDYRDAHVAPGASVEVEDFDNLEALSEVADENGDVNLFAISQGVSLVPDDFFSDRGSRAYGYSDTAGMETLSSVKSAIRAVQYQLKNHGKVIDMPTIKVYRSVPNDIEEEHLQSEGQWVSPSRTYVDTHGRYRFGEGAYRIIEQEVPITHLWWDGNDAREWGFDDGSTYRYKNTANNIKSHKAVEYDDAGAIIPLSKRFDELNSDYRFRQGDATLVSTGNTSDRKQAVSSLPLDTEVSVVEVPSIGLTYDEAVEVIDNLPSEIDARHTPEGVETLRISRKTRRKLMNAIATTSGDLRGAYMDMLPHLEEVISNSLLLEEHRDRVKDSDGNRLSENDSDPNIDKVQRLYGAVSIGDKVYRVKTTAHVFTNLEEGSKLHNYDITRIELLLPLTSETSIESLHSGTNNSIQELPTSIPEATFNGDQQRKPIGNSISLAKLIDGVELSYGNGVLLSEAMEEARAKAERTRLRNEKNKAVEKRRAQAKARVEAERRYGERAEELGQELGVPVRVVQDVSDISHQNKSVQARMRRAKGWFDPSTGEVVVVAPNADSVSDVEATIYHEIVGHKGLRQVVGDKAFNGFLHDVYRNMPDDVKAEVTQGFLSGKYGSLEEATEEYIARLAEQGFGEERSMLRKVVDKLRDFLRNTIGLDLAFTDNDLRYMLWKSYHLRQRQGILEQAQDIDMQRRMQAGMFRESVNSSAYESEVSRIKSEAEANGTFMLAPNGEPTKLSERQWLQVRTKAFKRWFGDWEKSARIEKLRNSKPVVLQGNEHEGKYELNRESAKKWIKDNLRGEYTNADTGDIILLAKDGVQKVTSHGMGNDAHLKSIVSIPQLIERATYIDKRANDKGNDKYGTYLYYVVGLKIGDVDYTAKLVIGIDAYGNKYYDHSLTEIEKGKLIDEVGALSTTLPSNNQPALSAVKDTKLLSLLQNDASKVVDENGEPLVVYHGTRENFTAFNRDYDGLNHEDLENSKAGFFFTDSIDEAEYYTESTDNDGRERVGNTPRVMPVFLSLMSPEVSHTKNDATYEIDNDPYALSYEENGSDGIMVHGKYNSVYVAFSPSQIKSATDNVGLFDGENADIRYRRVGASSTNAGQARREYNQAVRVVNNKGKKSNKANLAHRLVETYQDSMLSLKKLQEAVGRESGREIESFEDAYMAENSVSSKNKAQTEMYERDFFNPLASAITKLMDEGASYLEIKEYMYAKHGLERNEYYSRKKAEDIVQGFRKDGLSDEEISKKIDRSPKLSQLVDSSTLEWTGVIEDFSGLSALTGTTEDFTYEAENIVEEFERRYDPSELWDKTRRATQETLTTSYKAGMMSRDTYEKVKGMFDYYIPLRGWDEKTSSSEYDYITSGMPQYSPTLKTVKGRRSLADDPIATIGFMAESAIIQGNRNKMKQRFLNLALNTNTDLLTVQQQWYVLDNATGKWTQASPDIDEDASPEDIQKAMREFEERMKELKEQGLATQQRNNLNVGIRVEDPNKKQHQVRVRVNGREYIVYVNGNPRAAQAVNGLTNPNAGSSGDGSSKWIAKKAMTIKNTMAQLFTSKNPAFIATNLSRDIIWAQTAVSIKEDWEYNKQYTKNISGMLIKGKPLGLLRKHNTGTLDNNVEIERLFNEFLTYGGETGFTQINNVDEYKKKLNRFLNDKEGIKSKAGIRHVRAGWNAIGDAIEFGNRAAEDMTRFAVFMTSRQMGRSIDQSINDAKEVTVNFNRKGSGGYGAKLMGFSYIFFNAAIQSLANAGKIFKSNPKKALGAMGFVLASGALNSMLYSAMQGILGGDDEPDYWDIPEWIRKNNLVFYIPFSGGKYLTIPLPHEMRGFFGAGVSAIATVLGKEEVSEALEKSAVGFADMLPLDFTGNGGSLGTNLTPTIAQPFVQAYITNTNYFGMPIYKDSDYLEASPDWKKAYKGTNKFLVNFAKAVNELTGGDNVKQGLVNLNPAIIEHLFNSYLGGTGKTLNDTYKTISMLWDEDAQSINSVPIVNKFVHESDERSSTGNQLNRDYYKALEELREYERVRSGYKKEARTAPTQEERDKYLEMYREHTRAPRASRRYGIINQYTNMIQSLNKWKEEALSPEVKEQMDTKIKELKERMMQRLDDLDAQLSQAS